MKSYILSITGNQELSKEILHKHINFMSNQETEGLYAGKNYALNFIKQLLKIGVGLRNAIDTIEERFLSS